MKPFILLAALLMAGCGPSNKPTAADVHELRDTVIDLQNHVTALWELEQDNREQIIFLKGYICKQNYLNNCMDREAK